MLSFVQFEFVHAIGPQPGRYVVASADVPTAPVAPPDPVTGITRATAEGDVLTVTVLEAPIALGGRGRLSRGRAKKARADEDPAPVPVLRATLVRAARPLSQDVARAWLRACADDPDAAQEWVASGLEVVNLAIRAYRLATADPYVVEVTHGDARTVRLGYADAEQVATDGWEEAIVLPAQRPRASREVHIAPSTSVARALGGDGFLPESQDLALRALLDLRHGRARGAAMGLRGAVDLARAEFAGAGEVSEALDRADAAARDLATRALRGPLGADEEGRLRDALEALVRSLPR